MGTQYLERQFCIDIVPQPMTQIPLPSCLSHLYATENKNKSMHPWVYSAVGRILLLSLWTHGCTSLKAHTFCEPIEVYMYNSTVWVFFSQTPMDLLPDT